MCEGGAAIAHEQRSVEMFQDFHSAAGIRAAIGPFGYLDPAIPDRHGIVASHDSGVLAGEAAVQVGGRWSPGGNGVTRWGREALVEFGDEGRQVASGFLSRTGAVESQQADQAILERPPEALDAALGLRASGRDIADSKLSQDPSSLGRVALPCEFLFERPVAVIADEDVRSIAVERGRDSMAADHLLEEKRIPVEIFMGTGHKPQDAPRRIIEGAHKGEGIPPLFAPAVFTGIDEHQRSDPGLALAASAVSRCPSASLGGESELVANSLHRGPRKQQALLVSKQLGEMAVIEPGIPPLKEHPDAVAKGLWQSPWRRTPAGTVNKGRSPSCFESTPQAPELPNTNPKSCRPFPIRDLPIACGPHQTRPLGLFDAHRDSPHGGTFSRSS